MDKVDIYITELEVELRQGDRKIYGLSEWEKFLIRKAFEAGVKSEGIKD